MTPLERIKAYLAALDTRHVRRPGEVLDGCYDLQRGTETSLTLGDIQALVAQADLDRDRIEKLRVAIDKVKARAIRAEHIASFLAHTLDRLGAQPLDRGPGSESLLFWAGKLVDEGKWPE